MTVRMRLLRIIWVSSLVLLSSLLLGFAVLTAIAALNLAILPVTEQQRAVLSNIGYGIIAGSVLLLLASLYNLLRKILLPGEAG